MRYFKLFIISVVVFSVLLFLLSMLFPSTTYVSRAVNVKKDTNKDKLIQLLSLHKLAFEENANPVMGVGIGLNKRVSDTLLVPSTFSSDILTGTALHQLSNDSTAVQVFYKIQAPWYKPWKKFALMLNESKYGPSLDSAISRIGRQF